MAVPSYDDHVTDPAPHPLHDAVVAALRTVHDPEIPVNIHDLGLIYALDLAPETNDLRISMTLTAPNCPMAEVIVQDVKTKAAAVEGIGAVTVDLVWEPKWNPDLMSEAAKLELEFTGHTGPAHLRKSAGPRTTGLTIGRRPADRRKP